MTTKPYSKSKIHRGRASACAAILSASLLLPSQGFADTWRIEAELAQEGTIQKVVPEIAKEVIRWKAMQADDASGGQYMGGNLTWESHPIACRIPHAGTYKVWVRHYKTTGKPTSFYILFRDDIREGAGLHNIDFFMRPRNVTAIPQELPEAPRDAKPEWAWTSCEMTFERPMEATISFGPAGGVATGTAGVDCVIVSDDPKFDPQKADWAKLPTEPGPLQAVKPPSGMKPVPMFPLHSSFFAGDPDRDKQIKLCMVYGYVLYRDYPLMLQLGFNRDRGWDAGSTEYGIQTQVNPRFGYEVQDLYKKLPSPEGRRVTADGTVRDNRFSKFYQPYREAILAELREKSHVFFDMDEVERYAVTGESGGIFDYSPYSRDAFHKWLEKRFKTIEKLNELWRTEYKSFADVVLPKTPGPEENKAPWFAFREFSGLIEAEFIADMIHVLNKIDPKHRPSTSQGSSLHINSPWFTSSGPIDFEDMINIGFAESKMFGYDAYSTEDGFVGCDLEYMLSLIGDREMLNGESNVHGQDPRIHARTYWAQIGKGIKGIDTWQLEDHPVNWVYSMWGMLKADQTPRDKLGAISDANHEIHRLERMLKPAKRQRFVKPVALYYSRMDLSLPQPLFDIYGASINSPYRVYATLRGLHYPVRWITPRQIQAGGLKDVGAVALVGVKYVPREAATMLAQWVKGGGCIIGDGWPGAFDEYDRPQETFNEIFGVIPEETKPVEKLTEEEKRTLLSEQATPVYGISRSVLKTLTADEFFRNVDEMFDQRDSQHPVAKAVGNWHLSGYDGKNVTVVSKSAEIIGQMMGRPGLVINQYGKGHALYSSMMLGTLYEAGPVRFEWDTSREGPGFRNILGAYLRYCGVQPFAEPEMPWGMARKMRIEDPLIDSKKNVLVGMISINDGPLQPFPLSLRWPDSAPRPKLMLACLGSTRRMERVPFEIKNGQMTLTMPGFDTHAMLLGLTESDPLVSLQFSGPPRGTAGLIEATPGVRFTVKATVWNPSPRKLPAGSVKLFGPPGWFSDRDQVEVGPINAYGHSDPVPFIVAAPSLCAQRTLRPIMVKYATGKVTSTPSTELVWWTKAGRR